MRLSGFDDSPPTSNRTSRSLLFKKQWEMPVPEGKAAKSPGRIA